MTRPPDPNDPFAPPTQPVWGGPHPHAEWQQPWAAPTKTNVLAVLSLVFAFLCFPAGLVLGIIALAQLRRSQDSGKGLAIAGVAISGTLTGFIVLFVGLGLSGAFDDVYNSQGRVGQVGSTVIGACLTGSSSHSGLSALVDCSEAHAEEVYAVKTVTTDGWPGEESLGSEADDFCHASIKEYVGTNWFDSDFDYAWYQPDEAEWSAGERRLVCVLTDDVPAGVGSAEHTGR